MDIFVGSVSISPSFVNRLLFLLEKLLHPICNQRVLRKGASTLPNQGRSPLGIWIFSRNDTKIKHGWRKYTWMAMLWGMPSSSCSLGHRICFSSLGLLLLQLGSTALLSTHILPINSFPFLGSQCLLLWLTDQINWLILCNLIFVKLKFYRSRMYVYIYKEEKEIWKSGHQINGSQDSDWVEWDYEELPLLNYIFFCVFLHLMFS